ncbi:MAG: four-carbon acid sugar kinase family protein, partial [Clostridia bacterium]|nr:four-carbon acid sugar kinase family protein [Clostridia bacterium]
MAQCIVIADDLTGANATGVLLKKNGFDAVTLLPSSEGTVAEAASAAVECDCLVFPTDSRSISPTEAYDRVRAALNALAGPDVRLYSKRIDSTLRGNLGSETDAFLDTLGPEYIAVCVPCFPSSGRVIVGSHLLVNGVPLRRTEAAADPKCPIHTTDAYALFQGQTKYTVAAIHLDDVHNGAEHLAGVIAARRDEGARILLIDSVTEEDLQTAAKAAAASGLKVVSVDPGPFTAYLGKQLIPLRKPQKAAGKVFCAIGSVNGVAGAQTRALLAKRPVTAVFLDTLGPEYIAVCVPCFPSSGRVIVGSHLLVNGVPLRRTEAAADP